MSPATAAERVRSPMSATDTAALIDLLMSGGIAVDAGAALLTSWAERGETGDELAAVVRALLARAATLPMDGACLDLCGTGGSGLARFNVSTTAAFVLAAAGVPVAKHGNRGSRRPDGSFDLLDALGIPFALTGEQHARLRRETGVCFLFARAMHPAVAAVAPMRKAAGRRTIFNLAGPLANPCRPRRQLIGVIDERTARVVAAALAALGCERACVVWGAPGIDEFSITGPSRFLLLEGGAVREGAVAALHPALTHADLPSGEAPRNAALLERLLAGEERGPLVDLVALNAGAAIDLWHGRAISGRGEGYERAIEVLGNGAAQRAFAAHRRIAQEMAKAAAS
ncbi:MAG TPA: anthranilate phosphoribosyltransferase [Planctomycetota bacterium]|nr:anthranilate phosphoribosyltransferase [Planctomycetota bacterium]